MVAKSFGILNVYSQFEHKQCIKSSMSCWKKKNHLEKETCHANMKRSILVSYKKQQRQKLQLKL